MNTQSLDDLIDQKAICEEHARILAEALRDLYNDVGEIAEVNETFNRVYDIVKEYA